MHCQFQKCDVTFTNLSRDRSFWVYLQKSLFFDILDIVITTNYSVSIHRKSTTMAKHSFGGRTPIWEENKVRRNLTITDAGYNGLELIAKELGLPSRSEAIEYLARQELKKISRKKLKSLSDKFPSAM